MNKTYQERINRIMDLSPILSGADESIRKSFIENAVIREFDSGKILYKTGDICSFFSIVDTGSIRVYHPSCNGSEVTYYRVREAECCILTISSIVEENPFPAYAITEEETSVIMVPTALLKSWISKYEVWNEYIFSILGSRMTEVARILNHIAFCTLGCRVATVLLKNNHNGNNRINLTHSKIALEIGSAREAVSRTLKELEKKGAVKLERNEILLLDVENLKNIIHSC